MHVEFAMRVVMAGMVLISMIVVVIVMPVVIVLYVVLALLALVLVPFLRHGHNWARHSLVATVLVIAISMVAVLRTDPPAVFVVAIVATLLLEALILFYLWHRDTSRFVREEPVTSGASSDSPTD